MKTFKVWYTIGWSEEDYLKVEAKDADEAQKKVLKANRKWNNFEIQAVEPLD